MAIDVGVDPGKVAGVTVLLGRRLAWTTTMRGDLLPDILGAVQKLHRLRKQQKQTMRVALELQYGRRGKKGNHKTLEVLMRRRHMWETLLEVYDIPIVKVWPATWQTQLSEVPRLDGKGNKRSTKVRSLELARKVYGESKISDDAQSDSALMARWLSNQTSQDTLVF